MTIITLCGPESAHVRSLARLRGKTSANFFRGSSKKHLLVKLRRGSVASSRATSVATLHLDGTAQSAGLPDELLKHRWPESPPVGVCAVPTTFEATPPLLNVVRCRGEASACELAGSVCLNRSCQSAGLHRWTIDMSTPEVERSGVDRELLAVDSGDNSGAIDFRDAHGWTLIGDYRAREGRPADCCTHRVGVL